MVIDACLVDTNVLLRIPKRSDPNHQAVDRALSKLAIDGTSLYYTHQNIAELWNTMTRPQARNGFGLSVQDADREVALIEAGMELLPDGAAVYREWRRLVVQHAISGVQVHDARLAAAMYVHRVGHILTLNTADFLRFSGLTAVHPNIV
jgi:predicted nucleic acid-binding protein